MGFWRDNFVDLLARFIVGSESGAFTFVAFGYRVFATPGRARMTALVSFCIIIGTIFALFGSRKVPGFK